MDQPFLVLSRAGLRQPQFGSLQNIEGFKGNFKSSEPFQDRPVERPTARLEPDLPQNLGDFVGNADGALIVSSRLEAVLSQHLEQDVEFLPIRVLDSRGALYSDDYRVAHLLNQVDCIDMGAAQPKWALRNAYIQRMTDRKLPLLLDRIPAHRKLFHAKSFPRVALIRPEFGEALKAAGFTGFKLESIEEALASL